MATRRANVFSVVVGAHALGLLLLIALALAWHEPFPSALNLIWRALVELAREDCTYPFCQRTASYAARQAERKEKGYPDES